VGLLRMPTRYGIDKECRLILTIGEGRVTFAEIRAHQDRLLSDPDFDASFSQLIDLTAAISLDISAGQARSIACRRIVSPDSRRAFVATAPAIFGMGRLMQAYNEMSEGRSEVHIFYDRDEALRWLGLEPGSAIVAAIGR